MSASIRSRKSESQRRYPVGRSSPFSLSNLSIKYRLPLLIGILLFGVIAASTWASYRGVKASALEVGHERLQLLTQQLTTMFQQSANNIAGKSSTAANDPAIRSYLHSPSAASRSAAVTVLGQFAAPRESNGMQVELWNANRSLVLALPESSTPLSTDLETEFKQCAANPFRAMGIIRVVKDTGKDAGKDVVAYPAVAAAKDDAGNLIGYLVRWRRITATPEARQQFLELIGTHAAMYFGNNQGDVWTDLVNIAPKPPVDVRSGTKVTYYTRDGKSIVMGLARPVSGTPWFVLVEFPVGAVVAQADLLLRRLIIIGLVLLSIGLASALALSRTIARPLYLLTDVASAITSGDNTRLVSIRTRDEFGTLASAFNAMVAKVRDSHRELERKVQERTLELETANKQLAAFSQSNALKRSEAEKERTEAIEALRNSEQQLLQAQKLEAVGRLAGGISHDFNNLLTAIIGYSDLALRRLREGDPLRQNLEEIKKASERAAALTRQLLAFSRKQVLQPKVFDLNAVVSDLEKMLRRMIGEDIELRTNLLPKLGNIKADPGQIEQVIMNLAVNARDAMPAGGKLTIETANTYLDESYARQHMSVTSGDYVMLAVSDTGTGMDQETCQHIFEPFFTTKEAGKGTGLGLSMVHGIVNQSGGSIWVYSEPGRGTTFKIYFPRVTERAEGYKHAGPVHEVPRGSETILLVEDAELVRTLARHVLETSGYKVLEAASPEAALLICENHNEPIDLLLTDVVMPGMSGSEMSERVLAMKPDMRVLYMSGYTDDAIVHHGVLEAGINFIQKPFSPDSLSLKVREVLDSVLVAG